MKITKAVITAASRRQRSLPLQTLVDSDGVEKSVLAIITEEALRAGVDEICVVVCPGDEAAYAEAVGGNAGRLTFVQQREPRGYGHAVACARAFCAGQPFLHLVGDHLHVSLTDMGCAQELVQAAQVQSCAMSMVQPSHESLLPYYGCVAGRRVAGGQGLYEVQDVLEKPTPTLAEQHMIVPGLRAGHYLCFFGIHVLTPGLFDVLDECLDAAGPDGDVTLSQGLAVLAERERYLAMISDGRRYDVGVKYGTLMAQIALALNGQDREEVLTRMLGLLGQRAVDRGAAR